MTSGNPTVAVYEPTNYHSYQFTAVPLNSPTATTGWQQTGTLELMKPSDFQEPRFVVKLTTLAPDSYDFTQNENGFLQAYFQLLDNYSTLYNGGTNQWENWVCALRNNYNAQ